MSRKVGPAALVIAFVLAAIVAVNYLACGRLNPLLPPSRIYVYGRHYDASSRTVTLAANQVRSNPVISIYSLLGKRLYTQSPVGEFVPTVIYLHLRDNVFLPFSLSGGP